jgi:HSP20 family molecular chaperone IbpA
MRNSRMKAFNASRPAVNMRKSEELVELFLALPGIRRGFDYSGMEWKFQLPAKTQLDDIEAGMDNGVLTVKLPQNIIKKEIQVA